MELHQGLNGADFRLAESQSYVRLGSELEILVFGSFLVRFWFSFGSFEAANIIHENCALRIKRTKFLSSK